MTNNDKFYEIFGVHMEAGASLCDICECNRPCRECRLYGRGYDYNQYIAPKENLGIKSPSKMYNGELNNIKQFTSMNVYKIIFNKNGSSLTTMADIVEIEDDIIKFYVSGHVDPVAVYDINNIIGFIKLD